MNKPFNKTILVLLIASLFLFPSVGGNGGVQAQDFHPPALEPSLSADGLTLHNGVPPLIVRVDPNPAMQGIKIPAPGMDQALANPDAANAAFSITYVAAGGADPWFAVCQEFPAAAKTAFNAAAAIWTSTLQSSVPITISACWANLGSPTILGYSGGADSYRDYPEFPKANTWYESSLANALHGSDLDATKFDDYITYNSNFTWYYGTDGLPPAGTYDLVTVAAHEIAHGLNFSGTANNSGGTGSYGYGGYPNIYDTFMEDSGGTKLTSYVNPSAALGTLLTSGSLWFNGSNANAANGGRVKIYAPGTWSSGSSYSHLDEIFNGTINDMMTYSVASGSANHNPGPVTTGLLKDLGWVLAGTTPAVSTIYLPLVLKNYPLPLSPLVNGDFESGSGVGWSEFSTHGWPIVLNTGFPGSVTPHSGAWAAWLGGGDSDISYIQQQVTVSAGAPYLTYYHWIASADSCGFDFASVLINGVAVDTYNLCSSQATGGWVTHNVNLSAYAGQSVMLQIRVETDSALNSNLFVDDVSFAVTASAASDSEPLIPFAPDPLNSLSRSEALGIR